MKSFFYLLALCLFCPFHSAKAQEPSIETVKINEHFYVLYGGNGQGSNVGVLIQEEGILLVDAMVAESGEKLLAAIRRISDKPIKYVFNTHGDFDHSGGNQLLAEQGAKVIAHEFARYAGAQAQMTFKKEFSLTFGDETIKAWYSPSHANSDITIYFEKQNALFLGDTFSNTWHPTFYATGMGGQYRVLDQVEALANDQTVIIPGHGFVTDLTDIAHYREGCELWMKQMTKLQKAGKSLEEMIADPVLAQLRKRFVEKRPKGDMPDMNFQRLIQRTLSSEFVEVIDGDRKQLEKYTGAYKNEEGTVALVFLSGGKLYTAVDGQFMTELLPLGSGKFHLRAWIDHEYTFKVNNQGEVTTIEHESSAGKELLTAIRP